jgi:hypothetical protein
MYPYGVGKPKRRRIRILTVRQTGLGRKPSIQWQTRTLPKPKSR